ncbi:chaperone modulator CbpM [Aquiflexum sp.]|uniref:chaperone modulator CbpM n=1 Tax=Aquiflexum sp. TaxID=1872584 RepID=UPI0035930A50
METTKFITITTFCQYHGIERSLIFSFQELGLIEIIEDDPEPYLEEETLGQLERMVRIYKDFDLNPQGIEVVIDLLEKVERLQEDNQELKRRLRRWEG